METKFCHEELVNGLENMLTEKIPYGDMVGAEGIYAHSGPLVYGDPESYFIEQAIEESEELSKIKLILGDSYDLDRLRELVEADKAGRVLPKTSRVRKCPKCGKMNMYPRIDWKYFYSTIRSAPFAIFSRQDLLQLALDLHVPVPAEYGEIVRDADGTLRTTGAQRTGCTMCGFGIHLEKRPHRFDRLRESNPKEWEFWMRHVCRDSDGNWYGWGRVLDYIGVEWENAPGQVTGQISMDEIEPAPAKGGRAL